MHLPDRDLVHRPHRNTASMHPRNFWMMTGAAAVLATAPSARPACAQTAADSAQLVDAVVSELGDFARGLQRHGTNLLLAEPVTRFDAWVMRRLQDENGLPLMPTDAKVARWIGTRGFGLAGDTAMVTAIMGERWIPQDGFSSSIETVRYTFVRSAPGWRLVRRQSISVADFGEVRG